LWHRQAFRAARALHERVRFDLVHQLTWCGYREPGYLWRLGVPFVWGPVGGTQNYPWRFLASAGWRGAAHEGLRSVLNWLQLRISPRVRQATWRAAALLAANSTNQADFARVHGRAPAVMLDSGVTEVTHAPRSRSPDTPLRLLWSGNLATHKALGLLLKALALVPGAVRYEVRVLGRGPCERRWRALARRLNVDRHVRWMGRLEHTEALRQYSWADVLVFTSLRDTSGTVVLEALAAGVPVICLDHQGAHDVVTDLSGVRIPVTTEREVLRRLADAIVRIATDLDAWRRLSVGARDRAKEYLWNRQGERMAAVYRQTLDDLPLLDRPMRSTLAGRCLLAAKELRQRAATAIAGVLDFVLPASTAPKIGVLTYHRVISEMPGIDMPTYNVRPDRFRAQIAGLLARGFHVWPLRRVLDYGRKGLEVPDKTVVITFDDGYECVYHHAWPVLRELGAPATVFVSTQYLDSSRPFPFDPWGRRLQACLPPEAYRPLRSAQCDEMLKSGAIELGSHTHSHGDFRGEPMALRADIARSLDVLRSRFRCGAALFAFPFGNPFQGFVSDDLVTAARRAGVVCGLTTRPATIDPAADPFSWGRFTVYDWDTAATLAAKLGGRYGWVVALRRWVQRWRPRPLRRRQPVNVPAGTS
jgi:glycosyltransferase involved in cell wall biosynthesis/peptidoglycan/xylan/chitin deacetylase (PgdA/CDA1 family)